MIARRQKQKQAAEQMERIHLYEKPVGVRRLVDVKKACLYASVPRYRLYILIKAKKINAVKDGGRTLVDLNSIDAWHNSLPLWG
jgi:Helix-turn-helix domain